MVIIEKRQEIEDLDKDISKVQSDFVAAHCIWQSSEAKFMLGVWSRRSRS